MINYNKMKGIIAFLKENAYPYYTDKNPLSIRDWQDKSYLALMHSLTCEELSDLMISLETDGYCPSTLYYKAKGVMKAKDREQKATIPTSKLIGWYTDKKSGKVAMSTKELMVRFPRECVENQRDILEAFLAGGKKEVEWTGRRLRDRWFNALSGSVAACWKRTHNPVLALAVFKHMPTSFILSEQEELESATKYAYVCVRLGNEEGFHMDYNRLSIPDLLYVWAKWDIGKSPNINIPYLGDILLQEYFDEEYDIPSETIGLILWSLGRLGMTDTILRIKPELMRRQKEKDRFDSLLNLQDWEK